jgi:antiviral helicase SKI2
VLLGSATKLTSQFRLTYNMILNLLRVEALRVQDMIRKSFSENAAQRLLPVHEKQVAATEKRLGLMAALAEISEEARQVYTLNKGLARLQRELLVASSATVAANKLLSPGRVVIVRDEVCHAHCGFPSISPPFLQMYHGHIGVVLRTAPSTVGDAGDFIKNYTLCVLGSASQTFTESSALPPIWPLPGSLLHDGTQVETITLPISSFSLITDRSIKVNASALSGPETQTGEAQAISEQLARIRETMQQSLPTEVDLTKVKEFGVRELLKDRDQQLSRLQGMKVAWTKEFLHDVSLLAMYTKPDALTTVSKHPRRANPEGRDRPFAVSCVGREPRPQSRLPSANSGASRAIVH